MRGLNVRDRMPFMSDTADWGATMEARLLDAAIPHVPNLGWTSRLAERAARDVGLTPGEGELLLPQGPRDLAALLSYRHDEIALASPADLNPATLKVRERIAKGVEARVEAAAADGAAVRRLMGFFALPQNLALGGRLTWESADRIWRWAGDASADENHYSKRAILAALLASTLAVRLASGAASATQHLERGIDAVMGYERAKARFARGDVAADIAAALARIRYGAARASSDATPA